MHGSSGVDHCQVVIFHDFTNFRIPPTLFFELKTMYSIFPNQGAMNLIHPLVFPNKRQADELYNLVLYSHC